jgi:hypothetical protein
MPGRLGMEKRPSTGLEIIDMSENESIRIYSLENQET